jgi:uncharacterized protein YyaL (SSP411 family)
MSEDELFYSASDADSEGAEGTYFVYTYDELYTTLQENSYENIESKLQEMGVTQEGNFEGKNIIRFESGVTPEYFKELKVLLQKIRETREYPFIDKKVQVSWSSMMIKALFTLGTVDDIYRQRAIKNLDALLESMYLNGKLYHTTLIHKTPKIEAFLEDYAFLSWALIKAFEQTQDEMYLIHAQRFVNKALEEFYDKGEWSFSSGEFVTKAEISDNTYTSSVSVMIDTLLSLGTLLEDEKYTHFAFKTLEYNSYDLGRRPIFYPYMLNQMFRYLKGDRVIKSSSSNLNVAALELAKLEYPFVTLKQSDDESFMICGNKSCFANTKDISTINRLIKNSF